jgi:hypothetical protein
MTLAGFIVGWLALALIGWAIIHGGNHDQD